MVIVGVVFTVRMCSFFHVMYVVSISLWTACIEEEGCNCDFVRTQRIASDFSLFFMHSRALQHQGRADVADEGVSSSDVNDNGGFGA